MGIQGLSNDIKLAIDNLIEGLEYDYDIHDIEDQDTKNVVEGKVKTFMSAKKLLDRWSNGQNAPNIKTQKRYAKNLIKAGREAESFMRTILKRDIKYKDLKPTDHKRAVEAKPFIYESVSSLHSGLAELELQLGNDEINYSDKEFKVGYPERMARGELFPTEDYHKDWYNKKEDAIKICPIGTEGEIVEVGELRIQLPEQPESKTNILFSDKPKSEQYWRRQPMPKGLSRETEDEFSDYIIEEFRRRVFGLWFMNNGKPTYITGHMYFWLNWYKDLDNGKYSNFRIAQNRLSYHTKACEVDARCLGQVFFKSRRTGFTLEKLARKLNLETMKANFRSGLTSKSGDDALAAFRKKQYAFANLPYFFKPVVKGRDDSDISITYAKPSNSSKDAKKKQDNDNKDYLNTTSDWRKTVNDAYDGLQISDYLGDECFKWERPANFITHWAKVSPTMDENGIIVGKAFIGSTMNAYDKGGKAGKDMYRQSSVKDRNKITKRTPSGLYRYFIGVHENSAAHTDKYGVCHQRRPKGNAFNQDMQPITEGALEYHMAKESQAKAKSVEDHNEYLRNHPRTIEHAFRDEITDSAFDLNRIQDQITYIEGIGDVNIRTGDFEWKNGELDTEVVFKEKPNGKFKIAWMPKPDDRNKYEWKGAHRRPKNDFLGAGGLDPYGKGKTVDGKGSKGSIHFINRPNLYEPSTSNMFVLEYVHRAQNIEIFYEDALMAAFFYGYPIFYESDKTGLEDYFERRGYLEYLMVRPDRYKGKGNKLINERGAPSRTIMINAVFYALQAYISKYVGEVENGNMGRMYFIETLRDWLKFQPDNRTAFDASISSGYALCAIQTDVKVKAQKKKIQMPIRMYNNKGQTSKPIY